MAISVDWGAKIINIPFADLEWVQDNPTVIRKLNLNVFRLALKDLEDGEDGMPHPDTHKHNTEVTLGGLTYARVIEIINGYTVTFGDGQYAVNLYGANSNVADVTNVNQVSVRAFNSAGLISNPAIEYASFNGGVTIDVNSLAVGTIYNVGTLENPVNNLADAKLIAASRGFDTIYIIGNFTFEALDNIDGYTIVGKDMESIIVTVTSGCSTVGTRFEQLTIQGALSGADCCFHECAILNLTGMTGSAFRCMLYGDMVLEGTQGILFHDCQDGIAGFGVPTIDMGGSGRSLTVGKFAGGLEITNKTGAGDEVSINLVAGRIILTSSVTAGDIIIRGVGHLVDNSVGANVDSDGLLAKSSVADTIWDEAIIEHLSSGSVGEAIQKILGLAQENFRLKDQVYDDNKNMTSAIVRLYANAADCEADTSHITEYTITATYDANNNCTSYKVKKV